MQLFPNTTAAFVTRAGKILSPWIQYLQQFTQAPPNVIEATVGASPYSFTAKEPGYFFITGGTISNIILTRGAIVLDFTGEKLVPVSINDSVIIEYSVLPSVSFIPIYGASSR